MGYKTETLPKTTFVQSNSSHFLLKGDIFVKNWGWKDGLQQRVSDLWKYKHAYSSCAFCWLPQTYKMSLSPQIYLCFGDFRDFNPDFIILHFVTLNASCGKLFRLQKGLKGPLASKPDSPDRVIPASGRGDHTLPEPLSGSVNTHCSNRPCLFEQCVCDRVWQIWKVRAKCTQLKTNRDPLILGY